jgi:hypothetical protein
VFPELVRPYWFASAEAADEAEAAVAVAATVAEAALSAVDE